MGETNLLQRRRIVCLSNVYDQQYLDLRGEAVASLSYPKRRDLFRCLEEATGLEVIVLSHPPKALHRRTSRWLPPVDTRLAHHRQFFCANWDAPKFRILSSWFFYARHVKRHVRDGDIVIFDNYEWIYVLAGRIARLSRYLRFVLDYEDGKHAIDKGVHLLLARLAESLGRPLLSAAFLAAPALQKRLPANLPVEFVPGFYSAPDARNRPSENRQLLRFIYSGVLDKARGVDLLIAATNLLPPTGWHLDITGAGELQEQVREHANRSDERITFHGVLPPDQYGELVHECHVGLNCQRTSDPISEVTFPSKIFTYFGAGLVVLSSRASGVPAACGDACFYYDEDSAAGVAQRMRELMDRFDVVRQETRKRNDLLKNYTFAGTTSRLRDLFEKAGLA